MAAEPGTRRYVYGAELAFKGDAMFAVDVMGITDTAEEAARGNVKLHASFGCTIYAVDPTRIDGLKRQFGICAGGIRSGYRILEKVGEAYDLIPEAEWNQLRGVK